MKVSQMKRTMGDRSMRKLPARHAFDIAEFDGDDSDEVLKVLEDWDRKGWDVISIHIFNNFEDDPYTNIYFKKRIKP